MPIDFNISYVLLLFLNALFATFFVSSSKNYIAFIIWFFTQFILFLMLCEAYFTGAILILLGSYLIIFLIFFRNKEDKNISVANALFKPLYSNKLKTIFILISLSTAIFIAKESEGQLDMPIKNFTSTSDPLRKVTDITGILQTYDNFLLIVLAIIAFVAILGCLRILCKNSKINSENII